MANNEEEKKIPVLTVLKNNTILKNIFLVNTPPTISQPQPIENDDESTETHETLTVGRHPDCNIRLEHPSISRFHLRIHSKPTSRKLSVTDLSSVHGTWVLGKRVEPGVPVELNEGDEMRIGGSSRVYRLHWVQLSRAYDLENPFVLPSDALAAEEETYQDENSLSVEDKKIQSVGPTLEAMDSLIVDANPESIVKSLTPSAPPMPEDMKNSLFPDQEEGEEIENQSPSRKDHEENKILSIWPGPVAMESVNSWLPVGGVLSETGNQQFDRENKSLQTLFVTEVLSERENPESAARRSQKKSNLPVNLNSSFSDEEEKGHRAAEALEEIENQSPLRRDDERREILGFWSGPLVAESVNSSLPSGIVQSEIENEQFDKENHTPQLCFSIEGLSERENPESPPIRSGQKSNLPSIWSRRGKPASVLIQTARSRGKSKGIGIDAEVEQWAQEDIENKLISKALFPGLDGGEENIFTPDKENFTPNTLLLKSMKKMGKVEEIKHFKSCRSSSSKVTITPNICPEEDMFASSDKENQTPKVLQERKSAGLTSRSRARLEPQMMVVKRRAERVPFQTLLANPTGRSKSEASVPNATTRSSKSVNCTQTMEKVTSPSCNNFVGEGKRRWNMVVDTTCLLNKESRKSLQLLQGLKGTQLIIPRIVIRELDCLKRRGSLFRRTTEVSSALQWIEECMVETKWWIHVQSSVEEGRPIAPTPPASPRSRFSEGSGGFPGGTVSSVPFSACGSLMEIVSPTAEDHILECALFFKRIKNDGQLVLLTNDVALKIKAMAEGLICETAEEFRESLVNPFSERFLWADSSPRGLTWSCLDDVILREKYYGCPLKKPSKAGEGTKGLKLILLHNSHYGRMASVS